MMVVDHLSKQSYHHSVIYLFVAIIFKRINAMMNTYTLYSLEYIVSVDTKKRTLRIFGRI